MFTVINSIANYLTIVFLTLYGMLESLQLFVVINELLDTL